MTQNQNKKKNKKKRKKEASTSLDGIQGHNQLVYVHTDVIVVCIGVYSTTV